MARIAALFRRVDAMGTDASSEDVLDRGRLRLDLKRVTASWGGQRIELTLTEFWMVHALARHPGHVKDRDQLMGEARMVVDDSTITSHVKRIRRKFLAADPAFALHRDGLRHGLPLERGARLACGSRVCASASP